MAIIPNVEMYYSKLDPKRPNRKFNKENPTWEVQIRTTSKAQKAEWEALGLPIKAVIPDEGAPFYQVNLRKHSIKADKTPAAPVEVIDGNKDWVDPTSIGNGSKGNIRVFQYQYPAQDGSGQKTASILMGIQLLKHIVYVMPPREDEFDTATTEVIRPPSEEGDNNPVTPDEDIPF